VKVRCEQAFRIAPGSRVSKPLAAALPLRVVRRAPHGVASSDQACDFTCLPARHEARWRPNDSSAITSFGFFMTCR